MPRLFAYYPFCFHKNEAVKTPKEENQHNYSPQKQEDFPDFCGEFTTFYWG